MSEIDKTFTFGKNWRRFLESYTPERQTIAKECLLSFLKAPDLKGKSFIDIGSGSGIHSAAAYLAGAARIHSFDYDPDSVAATRHLHELMGSPSHWTIEQGSVLDDEYMNKLGTFDIVYSWGVLHHTGDQWHAIANAANCMHEKSLFFIALYAKEMNFDWKYWQVVKKRYNEIGATQKLIMEMKYCWSYCLNQSIFRLFVLPIIMWNYKKSRGMALWSDIRDWLGGWPTEFSSVPEVFAFLKEKFGLVGVNLKVGEGNTEFLFMKKEAAEKNSMTIINEERDDRFLPLLNEDLLPSIKQPVWIFGAAKAGQIVYDFLIGSGKQVEGFVEPEATKKMYNGLRVLSFKDFAAEVPKGTPVVIASKYVRQNMEMLQQQSYMNIINGYYWAKRDASKKPSLV